VEASNILLGVVGKTNVGKSTFFSAATEIDVPIENRPFVTIEPNVGVTYVRTRCAHVDLGLPKCDASNSLCKLGWRFIPVKIVDVAGLVPGAHQGRGLGNKFLDHVRRADALLLVVDASGSTDEEGRPAKPGSYDPVLEVKQMVFEIEEWMYSILLKDWDKLARYVDTMGSHDVAGVIAQRVSGLSITRQHVIKALEDSGLESKKLTSWTKEDLRLFVSKLRAVSKPMVIVANKADIPVAEDNIRRLREAFKDTIVVPTSSIAELVLRKAAARNLVEYLPGDGSFGVKGNLPPDLARVLEKIEEHVLKKWGSTGVQQALNEAVFNLLDNIVVYPVEDYVRFTDKQGRVLPDALIVPRGSTARDVAYRIHTELGDTFLYAINAKTRQRVGESYRVNDGDVIKIVATAARRA